MNDNRRDLIERLLQLIRDGEIVENGKLPTERQLAELLGTTRPCAREATIALEALGVLDIRDRQGIFLAEEDSLSAERLVEGSRVWPMNILSQVMEIRQLLEPESAALAALRRDEEDLSRMDECMEVLEKLHREDGPEEAELGAYWNSVLHRAIFNATGNTLMVQLYGSLWDMMQRWVRSMRVEGLRSPDPDYAESILRQHRELVESIRAADPKRARNAMKEHLLFSVETLARQGKVRPLPGFFDPR